MTPKAIVYTSNTGHTARYAEILSKKTGLPAFSAEKAKTALGPKTPIIYMGWLFASDVKGYREAAKRYSVCAVCGVGLCTTGSLIKEVRKTARIPVNVPIFTVQGGMDHDKLRGINRLMIKMLTRFMSKKKNKTAEDIEKLALLLKGGDYVDPAHLSALLKWWESGRKA